MYYGIELPKHPCILEFLHTCLERLRKPILIAKQGTCCGFDMVQIQSELVECRQEVILPVIQSVCRTLGIYENVQVWQHEFPPSITPGKSLAAYLHVRQFVPYSRLAEMFRYVFHMVTSERVLVKAMNRVTKKAIPAYELICNRVKTADVNGADETGMKINGGKGWFWALLGKLFTFIIVSLNRGAASLEQHFTDGLAFSVLVHDCWKSYFKVTAVAHQYCLAQILSEFNHINDCYKLKWAADFRQLFMETIAESSLKSGIYVQIQAGVIFDPQLTRC